MNRRGFLQGILALGMATAIVRADSLMRIVPREAVVLKPASVWPGVRESSAPAYDDMLDSMVFVVTTVLPDEFAYEFGGPSVIRHGHGLSVGDRVTIEGVYPLKIYAPSLKD